MARSETGRTRFWLPCVLGVEILLFLPSLLGNGIIRAPLSKGSESTGLFYAWQLFWRDEVSAGRAPFWNPYIFGGMPIVGEPQARTFYPGHLLSLVLPPEFAFKLSFLLHVLLGSWLMYRLVRELGASRVGASVSALAFGLHGQLIGFIYAGWIHQVIPIAWAPGVVWMFCRALRDPRRWPGRPIFAGGALLGLQMCSGHPEWVRYTLYLLGILAIGGAGLGRRLSDGTTRDSAVPRRRSGRPEPWSRGGRPRSLTGRLTICGTLVVLGLLIGGIQLLPLVQAARHSARAQTAVATGEVRRGAGLPILTLPTIVAPRLFGPWDQTISADGLVHKLSGSLVNYGESLIYVGVLPLLLAIVAWRRALTGANAWTAIALAGVLFALNDWTHLVSAIDRVVTLDAAFRSPARFVFLTNFALAVLAGLGTTHLAEAARETRQTGRQAIVIAAALAAAGGLAWALRSTIVSVALARVHVPAYVSADPLVAVDGGRALGLWAIGHAAGAAVTAAAMLAAAGGIAIWAARRFDGLVQAVVIVAVAVDLGLFARPLLTSIVPTSQVYAADAKLLAPVAGDRSARVSATRLSAFSAGDNVTMVFRVRSLIGYDSFSLAEWDRLWRVASQGDPDVLSAAGVTHVVKAPDKGQAVLLPLPRPRGHLWWTDRAATAPTPDASVDLLPGRARENVVVLDGPVASQSLPLPNATSDGISVTVEEDVPGRLRATIRTPHAGWAVFTEMFYPGWIARVNGSPAPIARAFGAFQAVHVPEGSSTVEFTFRPTIVWWGLGTTLLGLGLGFVMMRLKS